MRPNTILRRLLHPTACESSVRYLDGAKLWCSLERGHVDEWHRTVEGVVWWERMNVVTTIRHPWATRGIR